MGETFLRTLRRARCDEQYDPGIEQHLCGACQGPLPAEYATSAIGAAVTPNDLLTCEQSLWPYREFLPWREPGRRVSLGKSWTPVLQVLRLADHLGLPGLLIKDEGLLPIGSYKARGAEVGVSMARELGAAVLALPTAGNAGGAWAAYGARAGLTVDVATPADATRINLVETRAVGARASVVRGLISDTGAIVNRAAKSARLV